MDEYTYPDFEKSVLVTIDLQRDFLDGQPLQIPGTSQILPNVKKLLDYYRQKNKNIIHIIRIYKSDGLNVDLCRKKQIENGRKILLENSSGTKLAQGLFDKREIKYNFNLLLNGGIQKITETEVIIYKSRWGAFFNTPLEDYLNQLNINTIIFTGCNYPNCTRTSIYEASERDFRIAVAEDAISGLNEQGKLELMSIDILVESTSNIIKLAST